MMLTPRPWYDVDYQKPEPEREVNWRWVQQWRQDNPDPPRGPDWDEWYAQYKIEQDRCWVAACFPQFHVWDWPVEDVALARRLCSRYICGVCGRVEDPGCATGC